MRAINNAVVLVVLAVSVCLPTAAAAQNLTAWWDPSPPQDQVTSFDVCIGTASLTCDIAQASVPGTQTSYSFTPVEGLLHFVAVRAVNASGLSRYSSEVSVSIPSLTQPSTLSSTLNKAIAPVTLQVKDPDNSTLQFSHTGLPTGLTLDPTKGVISGTPTVQGTFNVTVMVSDPYWSSSRSFIWTVGDGSLPTVAITSHVNGQTLSSANVTITGTATDGGTGDSGIVLVTVNGQPASGGTVTGSGVANWSRNVTLSKSGANVVTVEAEDGSTNRRIVSITLNVPSPDAAAPVVAITSHTNGQSVTASSATIAGTASDGSTGGSGIVSVTVNGQAATGGTASGTATANWSRTLSLAPGANVFTVVATDGAGNQRLTQITVNRVAPDTAPPSIGISSHTNGQTVTTSSITLRGTASDSAWGGNGVASVTVNGQAASGGTVSGSATANWSRTISLSAGANTITVVATDGVGNFRSSSLSLVLVTKMTSASLSSSRTSPSPIGSAVTWAASGAGGVAPYQYQWYLRSGSTWTMARSWSTTSTLSWTPTQAGVYAVAIWARSANSTSSQWEAYAEQTFVVGTGGSADTTGPILTIDSHANGQTVTTSSITLSGRALDDAAGGNGIAGVSVNGISVSGAAASGTSTVLWSRTVTLVAGQNVFTVVAIDGLGNQTSRQVTLTYAASSGSAAPAPAPQSRAMTAVSLTANQPSPSMTNSTVWWIASGAGGASPYQFQWYMRQGGGAWTLVRGWSATASLAWTPTDPGTYVFAVWARSASSTSAQWEAYAERSFSVTR